MTDKTIQFSIKGERERESESVMHKTLCEVFDALKEKGYNPVGQLVCYLLSEDPTYITTHNNARALIRRIDRDELLRVMLTQYLNGADNTKGETK